MNSFLFTVTGSIFEAVSTRTRETSRSFFEKWALRVILEQSLIDKEYKVCTPSQYRVKFCACERPFLDPKDFYVSWSNYHQVLEKGFNWSHSNNIPAVISDLRGIQSLSHSTPDKDCQCRLLHENAFIKCYNSDPMDLHTINDVNLIVSEAHDSVGLLLQEN